MINNYNSMSYRKVSVLSSQEPEVVGNAPNSEGKLRWSWLMSLVVFLTVFFGQNSLAQVSYSESFTASAGGWTGFSQFADATACGGGGGAVRFNLWSSSTSATFVSPSLGTADGTTSQTLSYDYKIADWFENTVGTSTAFGSFLVQWSNSASGPWNTIQTIDGTNHIVSGSCANKSLTFTPTAGPLFVRFSATWNSGDYYLNFDNVNVSFVPTTVPSCATNLLPVDGSVNVLRATPLSWTSVPGASTYDLYFGTSTPAVFAANVTGTSYTPPTTLLANTTYYYKVVPKNINGDAIGCVEQSFTTGNVESYCTPVYTSGKTAGDLISNISISGTSLSNNSGTAQVNPAYTFFSGQPNYTATLQAGSSYNVNVTVGTWGNQAIKAWIDYNDNGVFEPSEVIGTSVVAPGQGNSGPFPPATFSIVLSCNPPLGVHRMRVRSVWNVAAASIDPCASAGFGETEDYDITISAADPCPAPTTLAVSNVTASGADFTWLTGCAETAWEVAVVAAGSGAPVSGTPHGSTSYSASGLTLLTAYDFYVRAECSAGVLYSSWSGPLSFTTTDNLPACTTLISPADGATNVAVVGGAVTLTWAAPATSPTEGVAISYDVYLGTTSGALTLIGNVPAPVTGDPSVNVTGLLYNQTNYWRIVPRSSGGPAVGPCAEWSFTTEAAPANDLCSGATDLGALTSPLSGSTVGLNNDFTPSCGSTFTHTSGDAYYSIVVPNGYTFSIGATASSYDAANTLFYGSCASPIEVGCTDPNLGILTWTNTTGSSQTAYWVQDGWGTTNGTYTLAWTLTPPPVVVTSFNPPSVCGQDGGTSITITGSNFTGATDVQFNGIAATSFVVDSYTQITAVLPAGNTNGVITVYAAPSTNGFASSASSLVVNSFPLVDPIVGSNEICLSSPTLLLSNASAGGTWSSSNEAVATVNSLSGEVTGLTAGSATISYTVTENGCSTSSTLEVTVSQEVVITVQPTPVVVVTGNDAVFSVTATGTGLTYVWEESVAGGPFTALTESAPYSGTNTNTLTIDNTPSSLNNNEYRCVVSGVSPCAPVQSSSVILNVGNTGISSNPSNVNLCDSGTAVFSVVATGDVDGYQWYEDQGFGPNPITEGGDYSGTNTATLTISNVDLSYNGYIYYVVIDGPANDPQSTTATLNVSEGVSIATQPESVSVCRATNTATFSIETAGNVSTIQWQVSSNGSTGWTNVGTGASLNVNVTGSTPVGVTYYRAIVSGLSPCAPLDSNIVTLTVVQPTITVTPSSAIYCTAGTPISLTAGGASTYVWSPATGLSATTGDTVLASPASTTTYTVTGTDALGCFNTSTVTVTVVNQTSATATSSLNTVCEGETVQLSASGAQVFVTSTPNLYTFATSTGAALDPMTGATIIGSGPNDDNPYAASNIGFTFNYNGTDYTQFSASPDGFIRLGAGTAGSQFSNSFASTTNVPKIAPYWDDLALGNTGNITMVTTGAAPNRICKIQWFATVPRNLSGAANSTFQLWLYETTGVVEMRYGAMGSASMSASVGLKGTGTGNFNSVTVSANTASSTTANNANAGQPANGRMYRFVPGGSPVFTYSWTSSPAGFTSTSATPTVTVSENTTYTVVVTGGSGCTGTAQTTVNVVSGASITSQPVAVSQCAGTNASFSVTATGPSLTYSWRKNGTPIVGNPSASTATLLLNGIVEADEASYDVVVTPLCGDAVTSNAVALTVNDIPTAVPTSNSPVCAGSALNLTGTTSNGVTFSWTGPNGFTSSLQNPTIANVSAANAGTYTFTTTSADGCTFSGTTTVTINANPVVSIVSSGSATTACVGEIKTLTANLPAPSGTITVPFGTNLNSDGVAPAVFAGTLSGIPEGATITSAQLQFTNVNAINGSWRSEIRVALNGVYTLAATQISTLGSPGLISPDPVVNLVGFPAASGAINLVITETFNDAGATIDATFGSAQLVVSYTLPSTVVTWSPTTDLYTDANATIPYTGGNATTVYAQMSTPVSYTVTSTNALGCVREATASYTMTSVGCPSTTNVQTALCGATLSTINQPIYANLVANAQGYRFRVTDLTTNEVQSIDRNLRVFQLTQLTDYAFNRSYRVEVSVRLGGVWQPYYGAACTVTTPSALTQVQAAQCGSTLTTINDVIYANNVPFATGYKFRITNLLTSAQEEIERPLRDIRITNISNPEFNTTYSVEVAVRNTDGAYLPYGTACNITTPSFPTTQLQLSQCDVVITNPNAIIYADSYSGATTYRFRFVNTGLGYTYQFDKPLRSFELNTVPGLLPGETYSVQVSVEIGGVFGPYGKVCTLTTPGGARTIEPAVKTVEFQATASPNPFAENFKLDVKTSTDESIQVVVYDMLGKQIEVRNVTVSSITDLEIGTNYPAGVYNVIVSQGDNVKTLRVIKR
jgi:GEVED domain/Secretion system C-terminal sorting domain